MGCQTMMDKPQRVAVTGTGKFPLDMLRHDCAWPANTTDTYAMAARGSRTVEIVVAKRRYLTEARWASFGWTATEIHD